MSGCSEKAVQLLWWKLSVKGPGACVATLRIRRIWDIKEEENIDQLTPGTISGHFYFVNDLSSWHFYFLITISIFDLMNHNN